MFFCLSACKGNEQELPGTSGQTEESVVPPDSGDPSGSDASTDPNDPVTPPEDGSDVTLDKLDPSEENPDDDGNWTNNY